MIRLGKKLLYEGDDSIELVSEDGYIHIAGMRFSTRQSVGWYLDGSPNGGHSGSTDQLTKLLYKDTTLHAEAKKYKGYLGSGNFPEFDTRENLLRFAKHLQSRLGY